MSDPRPVQPQGAADPAAPSEPKPSEPAAAPKPAAPARPPAPAKPEVPSLTPLEMIGPTLKADLEAILRSGDPIDIEAGKSGSFTGRVFRLMLHEGWIALEHADGRRRAFMLIEGGRIKTRSGVELALPGGRK